MFCCYEGLLQSCYNALFVPFENAWWVAIAALPSRLILVLLLLSTLLYVIYRLIHRMLGQNNTPISPQDQPKCSTEDLERARSFATADLTKPLFTPPLRTQGRHIVDARGSRFKLASVNWYGASDELHIPGGLDVQHRRDIALTIRKMGFNSVRLPYSDEMVRTNPAIPRQLLSANADLVGSHALDVYAAVVECLTEAGLAVIPNNHITTARWCCDGLPCDLWWANNWLGPLCKESQNEEGWIRNWETVMRPHVANQLVVGVDLRNEPRGLFGPLGWELWARACERVSARLLAMQPNWLIVVEGTASSNDLSRAKSRPIRLPVASRLVYSAHVYGWSGWGQLSPYSGRVYESFAKAMRRNWGYLLDRDVAPVWVGEFGAPRDPSTGDARYWRNLMRYLAESDADFAYWALNPRKPAGNEDEWYSIVADDWKTPLYDYRLCSMARLMRRRNRKKTGIPG